MVVMSRSIARIASLRVVSCCVCAVRGVLDYAFEGAPQHRGVSGVGLVFQRRQDTARDRGNIGLAAPASDGKPVRYLDEKPVWVGERFAGVLRT